jgi:hypothetical protein
MRTLDREHIRPVLESEIERLINALDLLDGDTDMEDGFDQEEVSEDEGAQCDDEGELNGDQEGPDEAQVYAGPCSRISTLIGGRNA